MADFAQKSIWFTLLLALAVALGPLATDMYLPTFPLLGQFFGVSASKVQWTLSAFMAGIAGFQLVIGPLTDRFGRKWVLVGGLLLFAITCYLAAFSQTIIELTIYRFLQSIGVCIAVVVPRAMVRDLYSRELAARQLSRMGTIMGVAPVIGPVLGGYLSVHYGWSGVFFFLALYAVLVAIFVAFFVKESLGAKDPHALRPGYILSNYRQLLTSAEFLGYAVTAGLIFGGFFAYISASSYVLIKVMGVSTTDFGYYFGLVVLGFISGTLLGPRLTQQKGLHFSLRFGTVCAFVGGLILVLLAWTGSMNPLAIVLPMLLYDMGVGIVMPQCQAGAMHPFPEKAGAASALTGFIILGFSALLGLMVANLYSGTQMPMVGVVFAMGFASLVFNYFVNTASKLAPAE